MDSSIFRSGRLNFEQSAPASTLIPDKGIPALDNPILDSPAACKAANRRETGEEVPGSRTKRRLLGAGHTPQVGKFPTGREKWLYEASGASGGVSVKCRPPMPCFRACPQVGTFATSSEKYRFRTMKGFPHKWGIYDAFLRRYSLSGTYSIKSPGWQFRYSHKLLIVRVSIIPYPCCNFFMVSVPTILSFRRL